MDLMADSQGDDPGPDSAALKDLSTHSDWLRVLKDTA